MGGVLWHRWRIALGVTWLIVSVPPLVMPIQLKMVAESRQRLGIESGYHLFVVRPKTAMLIGVIGCSIGIVLIIWQKYRDRKERNTITTEERK